MQNFLDICCELIQSIEPKQHPVLSFDSPIFPILFETLSYHLNYKFAFVLLALIGESHHFRADMPMKY
jgi:hypothetical protein